MPVVGPALLLSAALGCGGDSRTDDVVEFWAMGHEGEIVASMMPDFERQHPGVHVRVQQLPWSAAHEKLLTAWVGNATPDVFQAGNTWLPELAAVGAIEPLDARIAGSTAVVAGDFFPGILDTNVIDGVTWGVPWYVDTRVLFYRQDLLAAVGFPEPPRTWTAWTAAMRALKARAGREGYAVLLPLREWQPLVIFAFQLGADLLRDDDRFGNFQSPAFRRAFAFYLDLFRHELAPGTAEASITNVYQDFASGFFALYLTGPWNLAEFERRLTNKTIRWATAPLPAPGEAWPGVSLAGGASLAISRRSPRKAAAWTLVEYLTAPAQQARFAALTRDLPARRSAWAQAGLDQSPPVQAFWTQLQAVRATPKIPEWERIATKITEHAEAAVRGTRTPEAALVALDADVDAILAKRRWLLARRGEG